MTPERQAEIEADLDRFLGPKPKPKLPKPQAVVTEGRVIRDAEIPVHPSDPNARNADAGVVHVRADWCRIDMELYEAQRRIREFAAAEDRAARRAADPMCLGLYEKERWGFGRQGREDD